MSDLDAAIQEFIEDENRDLKYKVGDKLGKILDNCTPVISYDYLLLDTNNEFSFHNPEFNKCTSEKYPTLSDSQIYFTKILNICKTNFSDLKQDTDNFKIVNFSNTLKNALRYIFPQVLSPEQTPTFIEIRLYTNKTHNNTKAPRIFGFIGKAGHINILIYDPFHKIFNRSRQN